MSISRAKGLIKYAMEETKAVLHLGQGFSCIWQKTTQLKRPLVMGTGKCDRECVV
jgi:hypothetical protein